MQAEMKKDPDATLDYGFDWAQWLAGDVIISSQWYVPARFLTVSAAYDDTTTLIWLSGGRGLEEVVVTNRITTRDGRQEERSFKILVGDR